MSFYIILFQNFYWTIFEFAGPLEFVSIHKIAKLNLV